MKTKNFEFGKYCTPAQLYLVLGAIGIISAAFNKFSVETLLTQALFLVIWAWVLNWLCSKGFKAISWILVLLPFIMALFTYFLTKDVVREGFKPDEDADKRKSQIEAGKAISAANIAKANAAAAAATLAANQAASAAAAARNKPSATTTILSGIEAGMDTIGV